MPSTMIHLLAAHEYDPCGSPLYWIGNFIPDYTNDLRLKTWIHLRNYPDRLGALRRLARNMDATDPLSLGWLLHLYTDAIWESDVFFEFRGKYQSQYEDWFFRYRSGIGTASYYLFHRMDWTERVWQEILGYDLRELSTNLPLDTSCVEWYRSRVYRNHAANKVACPPEEYSWEYLMKFAQTIARDFKAWIDEDGAVFADK